MNRGEELGFDRIRQDDELLDRLGARECTGGADPLEGLLAAWTASIDADASEADGPFGLRRTGASAASAAGDVTPIGAPTRTVQIRSSRAAALVGAAVLVMSGGGVAAAVTGQDVPIVSHIVAAARPGLLPTADPTTDAQSQAWVTTVDRLVHAKLAAGDTRGANELLAVIPPAAAVDPTVAAKVAELRGVVAGAVAQAASPSATPTPTTTPTTLPPVAPSDGTGAGTTTTAPTPTGTGSGTATGGSAGTSTTGPTTGGSTGTTTGGPTTSARPSEPSTPSKGTETPRPTATGGSGDITTSGSKPTPTTSGGSSAPTGSAGGGSPEHTGTATPRPTSTTHAPSTSTAQPSATGTHTAEHGPAERGESGSRDAAERLESSTVTTTPR